MKAIQQDLSIKCGSIDDTFEELKELCDNEAKKLCSKIAIESNSIVEIPFWTKDFPELICVGKFSKNKDGMIVFDLDFSQSTL